MIAFLNRKNEQNMKFNLSTLFVFTVVFAILLACYLYVQREKAEIEKGRAQNTAMAKRLRKKMWEVDRRNEPSNSLLGFYDQKLNQKLGLLDNDKLNKTKPHIRFVFMPIELGGTPPMGNPYSWRWRAYIPEPLKFELCWATENIPSSGFDLPAKSISYSHIEVNPKSMPPNASFGGGNGFVVPEAFIPLELLIQIRVDSTENRNRLGVHYVISQFGDLHQGKFTEFDSTDLIWNSLIQQNGGFVFGSAIETSTEIGFYPDPHASSFSFDSPTLLLRIRAKRKLADGQFENIDGPTKGLMIWLQKRRRETIPETLKTMLDNK